MADSVSDRVKKVIAGVLKIDADSINDNARFVEDLGSQSIQSIELVAAFEEEFDIEMESDEALAVKTVSGAVEFISHALESQKRSSAQ